MRSRGVVFEDIIGGVDGGVGGIDFATIAAYESEVFDVAGGVASDVGGDITTDVAAGFVSVVGSIGVVSTHEMIDRERIDVVGLVGTISVAKIEEKDSGFDAVWGVDFDSFSGAGFLAWCSCTY